MKVNWVWCLSLGLLSFVPLVSLLYTLAMAVNPAVVGITVETTVDSDRAFSIFLIAVVVLGVVSMALTLYFIYVVFRSREIPPEQKALWGIVLFMANALVFPVFWYLYIWRSTRSRAS